MYVPVHNPEQENFIW